MRVSLRFSLYAITRQAYWRVATQSESITSRVSVRYTSRMADNGSGEKPKTAKQLEKERIKREKQAKFAEKQAKLAAAAKTNTVRQCICTVCVTSSLFSPSLVRVVRVARVRRRLWASRL